MTATLQKRARLRSTRNAPVAHRAGSVSDLPPPRHYDRSLPIGVFDSGIGGLTVVQQLHRLMPEEDLIYLGDTARVPYGTKSPETVILFACEDANFLLRQGVKAIVVACNTVSAWALPTLRREFDLPIFGVIEPGVDMAVRRSKSGRIGVIGTRATVRSDAYAEGILRRRPKARVYSQACPLLVPLVEEGWTNREVTTEVLRTYLTPLIKRRIDTLILGCTHYPLLKSAIQAVVGPDVTLIDSARSCADYVRAELKVAQALRRSTRPGVIRPFVTDEAERFAVAAGRFLRVPSEPALRTELGAFVSQAASKSR